MSRYVACLEKEIYIGKYGLGKSSFAENEQLYVMNTFFKKKWTWFNQTKLTIKERNIRRQTLGESFLDRKRPSVTAEKGSSEHKDGTKQKYNRLTKQRETNNIQP